MNIEGSPLGSQEQGGQPAFERSETQAEELRSILADTRTREALTDEEWDESPNRVRNTDLTREMALAAEEYRNGNPLSENPTERQRELFEIGLHDAMQEAESKYFLGPEKYAKRRAEQKRKRQTDPLTGLADKEAFEDALDTAEADPELAIIRFDANNFGKINKIKDLDEPAGDAAIIELANAIRAAAEKYESNRVFRHGGDEFAVIASKEVADMIVSEAVRLFDERLASDEPLVSPRGKHFGTERFRELLVSLSGAWGNTFDDGSEPLKEAKRLRKEADMAKGQAKVT